MLVQGRMQLKQREMYRIGAEGGVGKPLNMSAGLCRRPVFCSLGLDISKVLLGTGQNKVTICSSAVRQVFTRVFGVVAIDTESRGVT